MPGITNSYEKDGYDGKRGEVKWWFEGWGNSKQDWTTREEAGRPPTPSELRDAGKVVLGLEFPDGHKEYRTRRGGFDV